MNISKKVSNDNIKQKLLNAKDIIAEKLNSIDINNAIKTAFKVPGSKIFREQYLRKELSRRYSEDIVNTAIKHNPAYAGISLDEIDEIAKNAINYETNEVTAIAFAAGIPGGLAIAATIPADIVQYFVHALRVLQKLAYLYGFGSFELDEEEIDDVTMNEIIIFLGIMMGVQQANTAIKVIATIAAQNIPKKLARKALTKGVVYPIVKKTASLIGAHMTKDVFVKGVGKTIPVIGGITSGGITYATFKPCCYRLQKTLKKYPLCNPEYYSVKKEGAYNREYDIIDEDEVQFDDVIENSEYDIIDEDEVQFDDVIKFDNKQYSE